MSVDAIMRRWPVTVEIFLRRGFLCPGCPIAAFHSIDDAIREHKVDGQALRQEIGEARRRER